MHRIRLLCLSLTLITLSFSAQAEGAFTQLLKPVPAEPYWLVQMSVYTRHFHPKPHHNNHQKLIGLERNRDDSYLWGAATFMNSFDQRSTIAYTGKRFDYGNSPFYSRLTFGLIHGYRGEFKSKVPLNYFGIGPVILPSFGVQYKSIQTDIIFLGTNASLT